MAEGMKECLDQWMCRWEPESRRSETLGANTENKVKNGLKKRSIKSHCQHKSQPAAFVCTQRIGVTIKAQLAINYEAQVLVRLNHFFILTSVDRFGVLCEIDTHMLDLCSN